MKKLAIGAGIAVVVILVVAFFATMNEEPIPEEQGPTEAQTEQMEEAMNEESATTDPDLTGIYSWNLSASDSTLEWSATKVGGGHEGTVDIVDGFLVLENGFLQSGEFIVDMETITESTDNSAFLDDIVSENFFEVSTYSQSIFMVTDVEKLDREGNYTVTGDLTIKDVTNEISFPAKFVFSEDGLTATANFQIDRTRWGIDFRSGSVFSDLGDTLIHDEITYNLTLVMTE